MKGLMFFRISLTILLFSSCRENICREKELPSAMLSQSDLSMIPYNGDETLIFESPTEPSITYYGDKRPTETDIVTENPNDYSYSGCKGTYYNTNLRIVFFNASKGFDRFSINMLYTNLFDSGFTKKFMQFGLELNDDSIRSFGGEYYFSTDTLYNGAIKKGMSTTIKEFHQTIQFGQKTFNHVYELNGDYGTSTSQPDWVSSLFFNFSNGIVAFKTNKGKLWYLQ